MNVSPAEFIAANTRIGRPPLTPEIALHLASDATPLWHATAARLADTGIEPPFWAFAWPGGQALARYLLDKPQTAAGRRVLDIATGSGLVAIAAAMAGAAAVTANDNDPLALAAVELNAKINGVTLTPSVDDLTLRSPAAKWDLVLAGDVFYDREMSAKFDPWLRDLAAAGALVLIGDPGRTYLPAEGLERMADYDVQASLDLESAASLKAAVWRLI